MAIQEISKQKQHMPTADNFSRTGFVLLKSQLTTKCITFIKCSRSSIRPLWLCYYGIGFRLSSCHLGYKVGLNLHGCDLVTRQGYRLVNFGFFGSFTFKLQTRIGQANAKWVLSRLTAIHNGPPIGSKQMKSQITTNSKNVTCKKK